MIRLSQCSDILIGGDLNCDFQRQTRFTSIVRNSLTDMGLLILWQNPDSEHNTGNVDYTHCSVARGVASYSTIDHFGASQRVYNAICEAGVIHSGDNTSNHSAIFVKINVGKLDLTLETPSAPVRVSWSKANTDAQAKYKSTLAEKLNSLVLPDCVSCEDLHCKDHSDFLEE